MDNKCVLYESKSENRTIQARTMSATNTIQMFLDPPANIFRLTNIYPVLLRIVLEPHNIHLYCGSFRWISAPIPTSLYAVKMDFRDSTNG